MTTPDGQRAYRIEDLSRLSGTTVRTIRAYTDRGLLPRPDRSGRANVYDDTHLARLRQIADLLERGYTLASIKELLAAWDAGTGLGGVLGLVDEVDRPWSDEQPARISLDELVEAFGGSADLSAVQEALQLGVLEPVQGSDAEFHVPSPQELAVAVELHAAGVPLGAITGHLRELRTQVEHISERFLEFTAEYVFQRFLQHQPTDAEAAEAAGLVRRLRPLAQHTVDAELARAMRMRATAHIRRHFGDAVLPTPPPTAPAPAPPAAEAGTDDGSRGVPGPGNGSADSGGGPAESEPGYGFASGAGSEAGPASEAGSEAGPGGRFDSEAGPAFGGRLARMGSGSEAGPSSGAGPSFGAGDKSARVGSGSEAGPASGAGPSFGAGDKSARVRSGSGAGEFGALPAVAWVASGTPAGAEPVEPVAEVALPVRTVEAVRALVGAEGVAAFVAAAADREAAARRMDALAERRRGRGHDH